MEIILVSFDLFRELVQILGFNVFSVNNPKMQALAIITWVCMEIYNYKEDRRIRMEMQQRQRLVSSTELK